MKDPNSVYDEAFRGSMTAVKTDWTSTYTSTEPNLYIKALEPLDYGHFQGRLLNIITPVLDNFCEPGEKYKATEFGALYGNSTLAYKFGLNWDESVKVWLDDDHPIHARHDITVVASDISKPALEYGKQRGIYDEICVHDFNEPKMPDMLLRSVYEGHMLFILMSTNYLTTEAFQRMLVNFLGDRSSDKLLVYNVVCAFDTRNLSPEALFGPTIKDYDVESHFVKHRNFSMEESKARNNCKESWSLLYVVKFDSIAK